MLLRGERERERENLFLHHTHNNKKFPLMLATRATPVRARPLAHKHTHIYVHAHTRFSPPLLLLSLISGRRKRRREEQNGKTQQSPAPPAVYLTAQLCQGMFSLFLKSFQSIQSVKFFPQPEIPKFYRVCGGVCEGEEGCKQLTESGVLNKKHFFSFVFFLLRTFDLTSHSLFYILALYPNKTKKC